MNHQKRQVNSIQNINHLSALPVFCILSVTTANTPYVDMYTHAITLPRHGHNERGIGSWLVIAPEGRGSIKQTVHTPQRQGSFSCVCLFNPRARARGVPPRPQGPAVGKGSASSPFKPPYPILLAETITTSSITFLQD